MFQLKITKENEDIMERVGHFFFHKKNIDRLIVVKIDQKNCKVISNLQENQECTKIVFIWAYT